MAKERGLYKRGSIWWIRYSDLDGNIRSESSGSTDKRAAREVLFRRKAELAQGHNPEVNRIGSFSFGELVAKYSQWAERQRSYRSKKGFMLQLTSHFGNLPLRRITTYAVEQYQTERIQTGNKPATINRHVATLKHMITKAVEWEMVEEDVQKKIRKVKLLEENNRRLRFLNMDECRSLLEHCEAHLKPIVIMALNTGMRKGEILSLKWDNVDLRHGFILLENTKNGEPREIPINETLRQALGTVIRRIDSPYVFHNQQNGKPFGDIKRAFHTACRKAGIKNFTFHDLRHTFASQLVMAGTDLTTVKELLGHKSVTMTMRYAHLAPAHKVQALKQLDIQFQVSPTIQLLYNQQKKELALVS